jgi:hypothetical protein
MWHGQLAGRVFTLRRVAACSHHKRISSTGPEGPMVNSGGRQAREEITDVYILCFFPNVGPRRGGAPSLPDVTLAVLHSVPAQQLQ